MEIGEEIYILRGRKYGEDTRIYQKGEIVKIYPTYFCVKFTGKNNGEYLECFNQITDKYKKELSIDDCVL